ncbi:hypothetical protein BJV74DRAFT_779278 [Russula compacta]|nr:hypothetical protein BJV74DRAFT_779278 [Russula compacta]
MPPVRTTQSPNAASPTTKQEHKRRKSHAKPKEGAPQGVSKIKSVLRQTRRLLAKEGLGADARIDAERKLKALEMDLVAAKRANKERAIATRYHKVKFFDRKKLLRKIRQTKKRLEDEEISSKLRKALKTELFDLRVDLNYVLNYPNLEKYISLYPPEVRRTESAATPVHVGTSSSVTDERREELREWVRAKMRAGEMSSEPEMETPEYRQSVQKDMAGQRGARAEQEVKARQDMDAPDDFFEEEGTGNEDLEAGEPAHVPSMKLSSKRRRDKAESHTDQHSNPAEKNLKAKRKKHRSVGSSVTIQDGFFGDESE